MTAQALAALAALVLSQQPATLPPDREAAAPSPTAAAAAPAAVPASSPAPLTVELTGFRSARGNVRLSLYRSKQGFPTDFSKAVRRFEAPVTGTARAGRLGHRRLPRRERQRRARHQLRRHAEEGLGVSNDAKGSFGPPKLEDARFELDGTPRRMKIGRVYL
jgi:uncharacterized protein (DUF2141 family)